MHFHAKLNLERLRMFALAKRGARTLFRVPKRALTNVKVESENIRSMNANAKKDAKYKAALESVNIAGNKAACTSVFSQLVTSGLSEESARRYTEKLAEQGVTSRVKSEAMIKRVEKIHSKKTSEYFVNDYEQN